ncbi:hypothetical protein B0H17DRAFT_517831 [Mycena rosella]|uniref:Small RNA 2'-O-methyltransferase n=1 Tax=Mycena rosella TaxID=1033263 RepID=A0AAD7GXP3_MYCRO|nr:hypothetical protein B0H17DRAFT_517831 [Mycena rosella]
MATMTTTIHEIDEHNGDLAEEIDLDSDAANPQVTFYPPLFLQRRIWILDILRRESIVDVLDVGCGEGQLLSVLAQPAPWLAPPPASLFPEPRANEPEYNYKSDMPNLHARRIAGLDVSASDLAFAVKGTAPPGVSDEDAYTYSVRVTRWEDLTAKVWKGGLQVINEEFVGVECIVCTEVIEHLPPDILPALAPTLLGIYRPGRLLLTTPSYAFNARFTRPGAPRSVRARQAYPDPTERTDRIFRHSDHKFEWTAEEFAAWCRGAAAEWGYEIEELGGVGRALEDDPWGRDDALGDASLVVAFRRKDDGNDAERGERGRAALAALGLGGAPHELLAEHVHKAHEMARQRPTADSVKQIGDAVKARMESFREAFISLEQMWYEQDVSALCGGWIEVLIWAVEEYEGLTLLKGGADGSKEWSIELVGGVKDPLVAMWPAETSVDYIPHDWIPGQDPEAALSDDEDVVSSTGADGDVSWNGSEIEDAPDETLVQQDGDYIWGKAGGDDTWGKAGGWSDGKCAGDEQAAK